MRRIIKALDDVYPDLKKRKILIIDDEADLASVSFKKDKETGEIESGKIASTIDEIRKKAAVSNYLQVTATPYSLYLQPEIEEIDMLFKPKKPCFTELV